MIYQCPRCNKMKGSGEFILSKKICWHCDSELRQKSIVYLKRIEALKKNAPSDVQEIISENINEVV